MKSFRERLYQNNSKSVDKTIIIVIEEVMKDLENNAEIEQYVTQIRDRRRGIVNIFENFNYNMRIIEENRKFINPRVKNQNKISYEQALDNIIKRRLKSKIESLYDTILQNDSGSTDELDKTLTQIQDRQARIDYLLGDYTGNMSILQEYSKSQVNDYTPEVVNII